MAFTNRLLVSLTLLTAASCGDNHDDEPNAAELLGLQQCCHLGEICHEGDTGSESPTGPCHDLGHQNDPAACTEMYEACLDVCVPAGESRELPEICEDPDADADHEEGSSTHD